MLKFFLFVCLVSFKQLNIELLAQRTPIISKEDAIYDLLWLEQVVINVHLSTLNENINQNLRRAFLESRQILDSLDYINILEFYKLLLTTYYTLEDVHNLLYLPKKNQNYLDKNLKYLGIDVRIIDSSFYVISTLNNEIPKGAKLISINNITDTTLLKMLTTIVPSEANNFYTKIAFSERYFIDLLPLIIPLKDTNNIKILPYGSNNITEVSMKSVKRQDLEYLPNKSKKNYFEITFYHDISAAYVVIESFMKGFNNKEFDDFLNFVFASLNKTNTQHLIIDLRNNFGGYTNRGAKLLSYFFSEPTLFIHHIIFKKSLQLEQLLNQNSKAINIFQNNSPLSEILLIMRDKPYGTIDTIYLDPIQITKKHLFKGNIYVLINGLSISTTGLVCLALRQNKNALFIGEPIPITLNGTYGQPIEFTLPKTKIKGIISTVRFNINSSNEYKNITFEPDIFIKYTIKDIIYKKDIALETAIEIIKKRNKTLPINETN